jgi:hypothetical protein
MLEVYQIPTKEFISFIQDYVNDEYLPKFKEMELQNWYRLYDDIGNSSMSDESKINHKKDVMETVSKNNTKKELTGLAKFAIGAFAIIKTFATVGNAINESQDSQWTRRAKAKYNNKK